MKNFVGIDLGKKTLEAVKITESGSIERLKISTVEADLDRLCNWISEDDVVALEAGNMAFRLAKKIIQQRKATVHVLNASELATIYASLKKTDREDSLKLARLIQRIPAAELPTVTVPSDIEIERRALVTEHELYTKAKTKLLNRYHSLLHNHGVTTAKRSELTRPSARLKYLEKLGGAARKEAQRIIRNIVQIEESLSEINDEKNMHLRNEKAYSQLALSIPGIGDQAAFTLLAFLGDGKRFKNAGQVSYYAGLVPSVNISGQKVHYGRIIRRGCRQIKRIMVQCAWGLIGSTHGGPIREFYNRLYSRIGKKKAAVAVGRKMLETFFTMLKTGEFYRGVPQQAYNVKLRRYGLI